MDAGLHITRRRKVLFATAAVLLGLLAFAALLEAGLRLFPPDWLEHRMRELNAGEPYETGSDQKWPTVVEGGKFRQFVPHASFMARHYEYEHAVTIDEWGGRVVPHDPSSRTLLPFLGDSFTFGLGVADAETFVALLGARTVPRLLNLGVTGSGLHEHLDIVEMRHEELGRPARYGFVVFMGNDLNDVRRRHEKASGRPGWIWRANTFVFHHPQLKQLYSLQFLRRPLAAAINQGRAGYMQPIFQAMQTDIRYLEDSLVYFRRELRRLVAMSEALDFDSVFVLIPDVHQLDARRRASKAASFGVEPALLDAGRPAAAIVAALDGFGIPHVDLSACLARGVIEDLYYVQDTHLTAAGHALAARCLLESGAMRPWLLPADSRSDAPAPDTAH